MTNPKIILKFESLNNHVLEINQELIDKFYMKIYHKSKDGDELKATLQFTGDELSQFAYQLTHFVK